MRQTLIGLLTAGLAVMALVGSLLLTFAEGGFPAATQVAVIEPLTTETIQTIPTTTVPEAERSGNQTSPTPTPSLVVTEDGTPTVESSPLPSPTVTIPTATEAIPTPTAAVPTPTSPVAPPATPIVYCGPLPGWQAMVVQRGETLYEIAIRSGVSVLELQQANCLITTDLLAGDTLYVPPGTVPVVVTTSVVNSPCGVHPGWVPYTVQRGDNLYQLSMRYGVSQSTLQAANCLSSAARIDAGQILYVPPGMVATSVVPPTPAPEPIQPLVIQYVVAAAIRRNPSVPGGAIVVVQVYFSGGMEPFGFFDEDLPQPGNPYEQLATCDGSLVHTARVESGDGQSLSDQYFIPVECPP